MDVEVRVKGVYLENIIVSTIRDRHVIKMSLVVFAPKVH